MFLRINSVNKQINRFFKNELLSQRCDKYFCRVRKMIYSVQLGRAGYISLISSIVISLLLLVVTLAISTSNFSSQSNILDTEYKESSLALAEACVDIAILNLTLNPLYNGNQTIPVGEEGCLIMPIETLSGQKIIKTKAIINDTVTNLKITVGASDLSVVSWEEVPKF